MWLSYLIYPIKLEKLKSAKLDTETLFVTIVDLENVGKLSNLIKEVP